MLAIALALTASLSYGLSDFLGGLTSRSVSLLTVLFVSQSFALLLLIVNVILQDDMFPDSAFVVFAVAAGLSGTVGTAAVYRGLAVGTMSVVAPVGATTPVIPVLVGLFLGEVPTSLQGLGIILAVSGIILASKPPSRTGASTASRAVALRSVFFGVVSAIGFGGSFAAMDVASEGGVSWALLVARLTAVAVLIAAVVCSQSVISLQKDTIPKIATIGILVVLADSLYAVASTLGTLGIVAVLSSLYPVITICLARFYLHEEIGQLQKVGILLCLSGVMFTVA